MKVRITLTTEMLGTQPSDKDIFSTYVASKNPDPAVEEMLNAPEEIEERGTTIFRRNTDGELILVDYMIKGFLKHIGNVIRARREMEKPKDPITGKTVKSAGKSSWEGITGKMDNNVHVFPREISLGKIKPDRIFERTIRAQTAQGPRVSLVRSETVDPGTSFECEIITRGVVTEAQIRECLDELPFYGIGQWRNGGYGRATWEEI